MAIKANQKVGTPIYTNRWNSTNKLRHKRYTWSILIPRALTEREMDANLIWRYSIATVLIAF